MAEPALALDPPALPELATVWWRPRVGERRLRRTGRLWTLVALAHSLPFLAAAVALSVLKPVTIPIAVVLVVHAWVIPELYAARGTNVLRPPRRRHRGASEGVAAGLLGDLLGREDHDASRSEFDRQRDAVHALTDLRDCLGTTLG